MTADVYTHVLVEGAEIDYAEVPPLGRSSDTRRSRGEVPHLARQRLRPRQARPTRRLPDGLKQSHTVEQGSAGVVIRDTPRGPERRSPARLLGAIANGMREASPPVDSLSILGWRNQSLLQLWRERLAALSLCDRFIAGARDPPLLV